ncbi:hypothetical protein [Streptomyces sp. NPDC102360]|uniref:hypothetical protein n=1 Tax=Streptomyces sp. NPDC102360 TaxID=3366160 RepID=UPI003802AE45
MRIGAVRSGRESAGVALSVIGLVAAAGCGSEKVAGDDGDALAERARQVADAWDGSSAAAAWRAGYHPTGEAIQLPRDGLRDGADQQAYEHRNFRMRGTLPGAAPKDGKVTWAAGGSLTRPLAEAKEAYVSLAGPHADGVPQLGFPLDRLLRVSADGRAVTVVAMHGVCDDGPAVEALETRGSVVLSATVTGQDDDRVCTKQGKLKPVEVRLSKPLGDRVLLDAHSGRPIPYRGTNGLSP